MSGFAVSFDDLTAPIEAVASHMMASMGFTSRFINGNRRCSHFVVCSTLVALGTGLSVLLYGHSAVLFLGLINAELARFESVFQIRKRTPNIAGRVAGVLITLRLELCPAIRPRTV